MWSNYCWSMLTSQSHLLFFCCVVVLYILNLPTLGFLCLMSWIILTIKPYLDLLNITATFTNSSRKSQYSVAPFHSTVSSTPSTTHSPKHNESDNKLKEKFGSKLSRWFHRKKSILPKKSTSAEIIKADEDNDCIICMNEKINTILLPCCHMELCATCAGTIDVCCTCRSKIEERRQVFSPLVI